ncbi:hypothetical protein ABVT39_013218 [Epinephelus coioides]
MCVFVGHSKQCGRSTVFEQVFVEEYRQCKKTVSRCITQAALQRLFTGAIPLLERHGGFDLLRLRPGPVDPSLDDLVFPGSPRSTISIRKLVRTPDQHSPMQLRAPELKRSSSASRQRLNLQDPPQVRKREINCLFGVYHGKVKNGNMSLKQDSDLLFQDKSHPLQSPLHYHYNEHYLKAENTENSQLDERKGRKKAGSQRALFDRIGYQWVFADSDLQIWTRSSRPLVFRDSALYFIGSQHTIATIEYGRRRSDHGQRFTFWTNEAKSLLEGALEPVFRVPRWRTITDEVPLHLQAVTDCTEGEKTLVDFIINSQGAEQHLVSVLNGKPSKWLLEKPSSQVPIYIESEEEQKTLFVHLKALLARTSTQVEYKDEVQFICGVIFPEISLMCDVTTVAIKHFKPFQYFTAFVSNSHNRMAQCRKKWKSLRDTYLKERRKERKKERGSGRASEEVEVLCGPFFPRPLHNPKGDQREHGSGGRG